MLNSGALGCEHRGSNPDRRVSEDADGITCLLNEILFPEVISAWPEATEHSLTGGIVFACH